MQLANTLVFSGLCVARSTEEKERNGKRAYISWVIRVVGVV
jgi:hypothetical protein